MLICSFFSHVDPHGGEAKHGGLPNEGTYNNKMSQWQYCVINYSKLTGLLGGGGMEQK